MSYEPAYAAARFQTRLKRRPTPDPIRNVFPLRAITRRPTPQPAAISVDPAGEFVVKPKVTTQPTAVPMRGVMKPTMGDALAVIAEARRVFSELASVVGYGV